MTHLARWSAAIVLLIVAGALAAADNLPTLLGAIGVGLTLRAVLAGGWGRALRASLPVAIFALALVFLQWISRLPITYLGLKTVAVFLLVSVALRTPAWRESLRRFSPKSRLFGLILFALFMRHFVGIFGSEAHRLLVARSMCVTRNCGRGSFSSLSAALAELFSRSLARIERFYAAQWLQGWAE